MRDTHPLQPYVTPERCQLTHRLTLTKSNVSGVQTANLLSVSWESRKPTVFDIPVAGHLFRP